MKMEVWLPILFILLIIYTIFIIWISWIIKCRKTARENKLNFYAVGYAILRGEDEQSIFIVDGLLGANSNELVFGNQFKDQATYLKQGFPNIDYFNVSEYSEDDFLSFVYKNCDEKDAKIKYIIRNMAGLSVSKYIPKLIRTRMICKIGFANDDFWFCYKNTTKNSEAIEKLKKIFV